MMSDTRPCTYSEIVLLEDVLSEITLTDEQNAQLTEAVARISKRLEKQDLKLRTLQHCVDDLIHNVKVLIFDLKSTRLERDALRQRFYKNSNE